MQLPIPEKVLRQYREASVEKLEDFINVLETACIGKGICDGKAAWDDYDFTLHLKSILVINELISRLRAAETPKGQGTDDAGNEA